MAARPCERSTRGRTLTPALAPGRKDEEPYGRETLGEAEVAAGRVDRQYARPRVGPPGPGRALGGRPLVLKAMRVDGVGLSVSSAAPALVGGSTLETGGQVRRLAEPKAMRAVLLAALVSAAPPVWIAVDAQTTEATGLAAVAGDLLSARERARDEALRGCVQQVATTVLTASTETDQAQLLSDKIYAHSLDYVRRFRILDDRQDGDTWTARVQCEVWGAKLEGDLLAFGIAHRRAGMPRVLVLVAEQAIDAPHATGWWQGDGGSADLRVAENAFVDRMKKCGFTFANAEALKGKVKLEALSADPDLKQAREVGVKGGAELVIVGRAIAKPLGEIPLENGRFYSSVAEVSARAIRTDTGEVVARTEFTAPAGKGFEQATSGRNALAEAGRMLAREMFTRVGEVWAGELSGVRRVAMIVTGVEDYGRLAAFKNALAISVRGVKGVQERSLEDGRAELDVALATTTQAFATDLATRKLPGFAVKVGTVTADAIEVELK